MKHQAHLSEEYELSRSFVRYLYDHFFDTIDALGGLRGLFCLFIGCLLFYGYVVYTITSGRAKRERKANKKQ